MSSLLKRAAGGVQVGVQVAPAQTGPTQAEIAAEKEKLAAEQLKARLAALVPQGFVEACAKVRGFSQGFPKLTGNAAKAFYAMGGQEMPVGSEVAGIGSIDYVTIDDPLLMAQLANDLAEANPQPAIQVSPLPPDAPASDPALASQGGAPAPVGPGPGQVEKTPVMQTAADPMKVEIPPAKTRGKKKTEDQVQALAAPEPDGALHIYVDCVTTRQTISLNDWAQDVADKLAKSWGAIDVRCAGTETTGGYEKWKGALMAFVRDEKAAPLPGGNYRLDVRFSSVLQAVAEGLEQRARASGGSFNRGVR